MDTRRMDMAKVDWRRKKRDTEMSITLAFSQDFNLTSNEVKERTDIQLVRVAQQGQQKEKIKKGRHFLFCFIIFCKN